MKKTTKPLLKALNTLETLSSKKETPSILSLLKKTMGFAQRFLSRDFTKKLSPREHEVIIKERHPPLTSALNFFNEMSRQLKRRALPWRRWMDKLQREIPANISSIEKKEIQRKIQPLDVEYQRVSLLVENKELFPSKQEQDAFRMKAITLLNHHEVRFTSFTEKLHLLREVPIIMIEQTPLSKTLANSIVSMCQTFSDLPGETIELKGAFKRSSQSHWHSIPISGSFLLKRESQQTGFPHPSQHHGWALSPLLLPINHPLFEKMKEFSQKLMPQGSLNGKAKMMLKLKQQSVSLYPNDFFNLHKKIASLLNSSEPSLLDSFFDRIKDQKNSYLYLSQFYEATNAYFLTKIPPSENKEWVTSLGTRLSYLRERNSRLLETLVTKQFEEFTDELEKKDIKTPEEMNSWLLEMLKSDFSIVDLLRNC